MLELVVLFGVGLKLVEWLACVVVLLWLWRELAWLYIDRPDWLRALI